MLKNVKFLHLSEKRNFQEGKDKNLFRADETAPGILKIITL